MLPGPASIARSTEPVKSTPTSCSTSACSLTISAQFCQTSPPFCALLICLCSAPLNSSTFSFAHLTTALPLVAGKETLNVRKVWRRSVKVVKARALTKGSRAPVKGKDRVRARIVVVRADKYVVLASSSNPRRRSQATSRCVDS